MRESIQSTNAYGGFDFKYRIKCDNCGEYLMLPERRGHSREPREFLTCGEDELCAFNHGWSLDDNGIATCTKCKELLASKGIVP